jgi:KDO2-lipid IV(A) lauroyltransferase
LIRAKRRIKHWLTFRFITSLILLFNFLSRRNAIVLGKVLGRWAFFLQQDARRTTLRNLKFALGKTKKEREIKKLALQIFENIGKNTADVARFPKLTSSEVDGIVQAEGLKHLDTAYKKGKGVIALTGHIGNFELLAAYLALKGYKLSVIGRNVYDPRLNQLLVRNRETVGLENISSTDDVRNMVKVLKAGRILGVLVDQDSSRVKGIFVSFLGKSALTPVGPAILHLKLDSPLVPMFILRNENEKYKIIVKPELKLQPSGDKDKDIKNLTQKYTEVLEEIIRKYPSQWLWMHKRWKSRPASSE